ncbi:MAG: hypothetical protein V2I62_00230 [Bacteroidales bacterium]|nr:hypothetical protein [Bacteroidales bacterium]
MIKVNQYENDNNFKAARDLIIYNKKFYHENSFELLKELIYINEKLSRYDDNLGLFIKGNQLGYFFLLHPALPKYKPYLQMDGFNELARSDAELRAKAIGQSTTLYALEIPKKYKSNNYYPVIFIFHGGGSNLQKVMNHWSSKVLNKNFIKVFLQSYRYYDSDTFGWKSGDERADSDILKIYKEVSKSYRIDSTRIYVAGISAGATYAIDMAFRKVIPVAGIIAFCPGLPEDLVAESLEEDKLRHLKAYIVSGENDYYLGKQRQMTEIFDSIGFQYKQVIIDEMGHQYPKHENFYIDQGIKYIEN